jgi:peptidoglycan/xylan/chitin deacetylase (PgdA/CDA1 family)
MPNQTSMNHLLRWQLKKTARKSFALGHRLFHLQGRLASSGGGAVRVLTYHRFGEVKHDPFCVTPKEFERQMSWLAENSLAVSLREIQNYLSYGKSLPDGAALVTMDDGCSSVLSHALPILKHYNIPSVAFVTTGNIGLRSNQLNRQGEEPKEDYLDWNGLRKLCDSRVDIGSHALTHRSLGKMTIYEAENEVCESRRELEQNLGISVSSFAYPYGTLADFNSSVADTLRRSGYRTAFTSQHGVLHRDLDMMLLPRIKVEGGDAEWLFPMLVRGGLDSWRWVDKALWRLQASGRG